MNSRSLLITSIFLSIAGIGFFFFTTFYFYENQGIIYLLPPLGFFVAGLVLANKANDKAEKDGGLNLKLVSNAMTVGTLGIIGMIVFYILELVSSCVNK